MSDAPKIIAGVGAFVVLVTGPIWYGLARGGGAPPDLQRPATARQCVEPTAFMRARHMELLDAWRDTVVREGARVYRASDGRRWTMSLTGTCLRCHDQPDRFCDRCHAYAGVETYCWDCHLKRGAGAVATRSAGGAP